MSAEVEAPGAFSEFFTRLARPVSFGVDRAATMADAKTLSLVESGAVDLFAVDLGEILAGEGLFSRAGAMVTDDPIASSASARWTFLCRVEAGAMVVGAPPGPRHSLLGRPLPGTRVSRLPVATLRRVPTDSLGSASGFGVALPPAGEIVDAIEAGLVALADGIRVALAPRDFIAIDPGETATIADGKPFRLVQAAGWVQVVSGRLLSGGRTDAEIPPVEAGETVFVTGADWLVPVGEAVVRGRNTEELLADGTLWDALERQQARSLYSVDRLVTERQQRAVDLLERRRVREAQLVQQAVAGFSAVVDGGRGAAAALAGVGVTTPDMAVMKLIGARMGLTIVQPASLGTAGRAVEGVEAIALASRLRTRPLHLIGEWWKGDSGPMIGYRKDNTPVALLPITRGYQLVDPSTGTSERVGTSTELSPRGTMLYRPLKEDRRSLRDLVKLGLADCKRDIVSLSLAGLVVALLGLLVPILTGTVLGTLVPRADRHLIIEVCILILLSALVSGVFAGVQNIVVLRLEGRVDSTIQAAIWDRLLALPLRFFAQYSTGELSTSAMAVNAVREVLSGVATTTTLALLTGLLNLVLVFFYSVPLALIAIALVLLSLGMCAIAGIRQIRLQRQIFAIERKLSSRVFQLLTGLSKLRVAAAEDRGFAVWAGEFTQSRLLTMKARRNQNMVTVFNAGFILVATLIVFAMVGEVVHLSTGAFLSFFAAFTLLLSATLQFTGVAITVLSVVPMMENLDPILACDREISADKSSPGELSGEIEFNHVSFAYSADGPTVLDDVSFKLRAGEFLAVVGTTGCGKSTLVRMLLGFETPLSGSVLFDGQDLAQLDVQSVRRQCGVVLQNGALLAGDIKTNIIGNSTYTIEDAWEAARMCGFDKDIEGMPMGMFTVLSEGASTLSGGQRQRLMIARALVSRPRILIMDEATSALDNPTQAKVAESTRQLHATRIVIAHRLSTIRYADRILVMDAGHIVQQGTFDELVADEDGIFANLARRQFA